MRDIEESEWRVLEQRLAGVLLAAFKESTTVHLRQNRTVIVIEPGRQDNPFRVQV